MPEGELPSALRRLLRDTIDSIEKLEIVAALVRRGPATTAALASSLSLSPGSVSEAIGELAHAGIVRVLDVEIAFDPTSSSAPTVTSLVEIYEEDRALVFRALSQLAFDRVRSEATRVFADAFVFSHKTKKEDPDG